MKLIKRLAFTLCALLIVTMIAATIVEQIYGSDYAHSHIYTSPWAIGLWAACAICSIIYIISKRSNMGAVTMLLHGSFIIILIGALTSHLTSQQGKIHLRQDVAESQFVGDKGDKHELPFSITLKEFSTEYYQGTHAPMDFVSQVELSNGEVGKVSMNNVMSCSGYRLYQSSYDSDMQGSTLMVAYDPYGIGVTYCGYALLTISMLLFFVQKRSRYHILLSRSALLIVLALGCSFSSWAENKLPKTIDKQVAENLGDIYIYYNDRICPLETYARDFTQKIYGKTEYRGLNAVQVLAGWLFYYDDWKHEPMIKIKEAEARKVLGIEGKYASLQDFASVNGYKLEEAMQSADYMKYAAANEKFSLISSVATGSALRIYPAVANADDTPYWYSPSDNLPSDMPEDQWIFIRKSLNLIAQYVYDNDDDSAINILTQTKKYQMKTAGADNLPSDTRFKAEKIYNHLPSTSAVAMICLALGLIGYIIAIRHMLTAKKAVGESGLKYLLFVILLFLSGVISLRGFVSNHLPLSNGFETMQFMAWCCAALSLLLYRRVGIISLPAGLLICGFALMVAGFGESNPQITQLMPVLASPLLSIHVVLIMMSYALFAFIMCNGVTALIMSHKSEQVERLRRISLLALYPALFMLAVGIFIGAVWANQSWGTYWSWDPKETWALITMLIYAMLLHDNSLKPLRKPLAFHIYAVLAFVAVLMTYFGVNFVLGGMHSYAG
jgi:ABC-type transport system involved in cytochrome c biogenesis permease subunit